MNPRHPSDARQAEAEPLASSTATSNAAALSTAAPSTAALGTGALAPHLWLNALTAAEATAQLGRCCGAKQWVTRVLSQRPFVSLQALVQAADEASAALTEQDLLEAFSHHPEIGSNLEALRRKFQNTAALSENEQAGVAGADEATLLALSAGNIAYKQRFGFLFIVCASGRSATEMLGLLQARLPNPRTVELQIAAAEHAKIARLRVEKLGPSPEPSAAALPNPLPAGPSLPTQTAAEKRA